MATVCCAYKSRPCANDNHIRGQCKRSHTSVKSDKHARTDWQNNVETEPHVAHASWGGSSVDMVWNPTMSLKKMVTQSKDSGSTGRPSLKAADTCNPHST